LCAHWVVEGRRPAPSAAATVNNSYNPLGSSCAERYLVFRHQNSAIAWGTYSWSTTSTVFKLIEHLGTAQKLSGMNSNGGSPTPKEDKRVSVLMTPPRFGTPLARTPCSAALSHDLEVMQKSFHNISDVRRLMRKVQSHILFENKPRGFFSSITT
jgi:hypothetical protein